MVNATLKVETQHERHCSGGRGLAGRKRIGSQQRPVGITGAGKRGGNSTQEWNLHRAVGRHWRSGAAENLSGQERGCVNLGQEWSHSTNPSSRMGRCCAATTTARMTVTRINFGKKNFALEISSDGRRFWSERQRCAISPGVSDETTLAREGQSGRSLLESQSDGSAFRPRFICGRGKAACIFARYHPPPGERGADSCFRTSTLLPKSLLIAELQKVLRHGR